MKKLFLVTQYMYLFAAIVCIVETIVNWNENRSNSYIFMVFGALFVFMYYFKKVQRNKMNNNS